MRSLWFLAVLTVGACSAEPRSASYFNEHPEEAAQVQSDCRKGIHRGQECENAELAMSKTERDRMIQSYREGLSR